MRTSAFIVALSTSATLVASQVTSNSDGSFTCAKSNVAYCASSGFLSTNIIIRCDSSGRGIPGNCNDNLAAVPPLGVKYSPCYQSSPSAGDALCSYNCIAYGAPNGSFPVPGCTTGTPSVTTVPSTTVTVTPGVTTVPSATVTVTPGVTTVPSATVTVQPSSNVSFGYYSSANGSDPLAPPYPISGGFGGGVGTGTGPSATGSGTGAIGTGTNIPPSGPADPPSFTGAAVRQEREKILLPALGAVLVIAAYL